MDVDALIDWAAQAAGRYPWATFVPDQRDWVIAPSIQPPLTFSMVVAYASLRAWIDGRQLTRPEVDAVTNELAGAWWNARMTGDYRFVADVLRDLFFWHAVTGLKERDREAVRVALHRKRDDAFAASAAPPPVVATPQPAAPAPRPQVPERPRHVDVDAAIRNPSFGKSFADQIRDNIPPIPPITLSSPRV